MPAQGRVESRRSRPLQSRDTTDFTPIYNGIEAKHPDVIIAGWAHVGVQPTVQWFHQHVPIAISGNNAQATNPTF
jgi:branched-chain amino acid transport system substrate-binding protein